ncbi:MAG: MarR family winged helix-turn-helix transcriptional regulator [Gammaproteobacteria bacterium]|nr:MarR family winged helix-turn-helix transcriptional regulator [Gammaproteobacteria bacterium]MDH5309839.1 MarR family winged helix-turn-helix transcriptional regulator [Gammaproteobacteria bacterium]
MDPEIDALFNEVRLLFHALVQRGENLHAGGSVTMAQRAVLEFLLKNGPGTVPAIARQRRVTRQHVQSLVNPLLEAGFVEPVENPEHRRSRLMALTPAGEHLIRSMRQREEKFLASTEPGVGPRQIAKATDVLRKLRRAIEDG